MMPSFEETVQFIQKAHGGQTDKSGQEYWRHPVAVAAIVASLYNGNEAEQLAALLHDVVEDTEYTLNDLAQMGYPQETLDIVDWVTKKPGKTYLEWIADIAQNGPIGAIKVKMADNTHNMRPGAPPGLTRRYEKSLAILQSALESRSR